MIDAMTPIMVGIVVVVLLSEMVANKNNDANNVEEDQVDLT